MKFATLFLIASTVLAMPTGEKANNNVELAKKEAASAGGFRFPTEDEDDPNSENYRFRTDDGQVPGRAWTPPNQNNKPQQNQNNKPQQEVSLKDKKDNNGNSCQNYRGKQVKDVPEECMKSVFCRNGDATILMGCGLVGFTLDNWTKQKLIDDSVTNDCVSTFICKNGDFYDA